VSVVFAGRLRTVDFDDAPRGRPPDAQRDVEPERTGRHGFHIVCGSGIAETHDGTLAELLSIWPCTKTPAISL